MRVATYSFDELRARFGRMVSMPRERQGDPEYAFACGVCGHKLWMTFHEVWEIEGRFGGHDWTPICVDHLKDVTAPPLTPPPVENEYGPPTETTLEGPQFESDSS